MDTEHHPIEHQAAAVYRERRTGHVPHATLTELARLLKSEGWTSHLIGQLNQITDAHDRTVIDSLADQLLAAIGFEPDFSLAPNDSALSRPPCSSSSTIYAWPESSGLPG